MTHIKTRTQITKTRRKTLSPSPKMISWHWQLKYRRYKLLENKITSTVGNTNHLRMENKISRRFSKIEIRKLIIGAHTTRCGLDTSLVNAKDIQSEQQSRRNNPTKTKRRHVYRPRQHC